MNILLPLIEMKPLNITGKMKPLRLEQKTYSYKSFIIYMFVNIEYCIIGLLSLK